MSVETAIWRRLRDDPGVSALVGQRITPVKRGTTDGWEQLPAITYQRISNQRWHDSQGLGGLARPRVQLTCWGSSWSSARSVADAVRRALEGWKDPNADPPVDGVLVQNDLDLYDEETDTHYVPIDVFVWQRE